MFEFVGATLTVSAVTGFLGVKAAGTAIAAVYGVMATEAAAGTAAAGAAATGAAATGTAAAGAAATGAAATGTAAAGAAATGAAATGAAVTGTAAAGAAATGAAATGAAMVKSAVAKLTVPTLALGTAIGATVACAKLFLLLANYAEWFNKFKSECEDKLKPIRYQLKELENDVKAAEEELEDLEQ